MKEKKTVVLIGVVNRKKDLDIVLKKRWYRIPVKYAPVKKADFVAFYQTSVFGKEGKCIRYYGKITKVSVISRKKLLSDEKDHPRAGHDYYKLQLGPLKELPRRIKNLSRRRMTFGFTSLSKLLKSNEVSQLLKTRPIELMMERLLKKNKIKAKNEYSIMVKRRCCYRLDFALFCRKGKINIECDNEKWHSLPSQKNKDKKRDRYMKNHGWTVLRLEGKKIVNCPKHCIEAVKRTIRKLGGVSNSL